MRDNNGGLLMPTTPVLRPYVVQRGTLVRALRLSSLLALVLVLGAVFGFVFALSTYLVMFLLVPLGILLGAVIWALPDYDRAPVELIRKLFFGAVIVMMLWPNYVAIAIPGLPWISFQRLFLVPLSVVLLVSLSISETFRSELKRIVSVSPPIWKMMAGFLAIQCLSLIMAHARLFEAVKDLFNYQLVWTAVFFASAWVFRDIRNIRLWFLILFAAAMILTVVGAFEAVSQQALWAAHIPSFLKMDSEMIEMILRGGARAQAYRVQATFSTSLACAEFLALATPIVVHRFMTDRRLAVKAFCLFADLAILLMIMETQSRLGLIGFLAGHAFYFGAYFVRHWRLNRASIVGPAITLAYPAVLVLLVTAVLTVHSVTTRVLGGGETHASNVSREAQWNGALGVLARSPLFGHGPHGGAVALDFHDPTGMLTLDSYLLTIVLDYGLIGFILFYGLIIFMLVKALELGMKSMSDARAYGLPIATALLIFLTTRAVLSQEDNNAIAFMLMGMTVALMRYDADIRAARSA